MNRWDCFTVACLLLSAVMVGAMLGSAARRWADAERVVYRGAVASPEPEPRSDYMEDFDYAEDAVNRRIADMVAEGSHPYMGDSSTRAWGGGWDGIELSCFGRKYLHYVSHNRSFEGFAEKCG